MEEGLSVRERESDRDFDCIEVTRKVKILLFIVWRRKQRPFNRVFAFLIKWFVVYVWRKRKMSLKLTEKKACSRMSLRF